MCMRKLDTKCIVRIIRIWSLAASQHHQSGAHRSGGEAHLEHQRSAAPHCISLCTWVCTSYISQVDEVEKFCRTQPGAPTCHCVSGLRRLNTWSFPAKEDESSPTSLLFLIWKRQRQKQRQTQRQRWILPHTLFLPHLAHNITRSNCHLLTCFGAGITNIDINTPFWREAGVGFGGVSVKIRRKDQSPAIFLQKQHVCLKKQKVAKSLFPTIHASCPNAEEPFKGNQSLSGLQRRELKMIEMESQNVRPVLKLFEWATSQWSIMDFVLKALGLIHLNIREDWIHQRTSKCNSKSPLCIWNKSLKCTSLKTKSSLWISCSVAISPQFEEKWWRARLRSSANCPFSFSFSFSCILLQLQPFDMDDDGDHHNEEDVDDDKKLCLLQNKNTGGISLARWSRCGAFLFLLAPI